LHVCGLQGKGALGLDDATHERLIGTHPLAGSHESGFPASRPGLFIGATVSIEQRANAHVRRRAELLWRTVGAARIEYRTAEEHDRLMAWVSHLPQLASTALAASLAAADVDPQVHVLPDDYVPLHYACDECGARRRLRHERSAGDHFAAFECSCGAGRRFHLGRGELSLDELEETGRWSTDVTLPLYLNDLAGGAVAGRSSALYGLVLNEVLERALGREPIPMLVPGDLGEVLREPPAVDSVLYDYLVGR
jgi:hypothetical protein